MKRNLIIYLFMISLILALTVSFVSAANETDDLLSDESAKSFSSIQEDINKANVDDTIYLDGYYTTDVKEITVTKSLTFEGRNNAVLDANYKSRIFYAPQPVTLTFKNITFLRSSDEAIATNSNIGPFTVNVYNCTFRDNCFITISCYNDYVRIEDSVFDNNYQALVAYSQPVIINNCSFTNHYYAAILINDGTISNSYFYGNGLQDEYGMSAIQGRNLKVIKSRFVNNRAFQFGGAIYCDYEGSLYIEDSSFIDNTADLLGGAIFIGEGDMTLTGCEFIFNSAYNGAAIYSKKAMLSASNTNFTQNHGQFATVYTGGGVKFTDITFNDDTRYVIISPKINLVNCNSVSKIIYRWVALDANMMESDFIRIIVNEISADYDSGKKLTVKLINTKDDSPVKNCMVKVVFQEGKKTYTKYIKTNEKGIASFDFSKYNVGYYNVHISVVDSKFKNLAIDYLGAGDVSPAFTIVKAPKVKFKYKKSKYFKVTVKNKATKKRVKHLKLKLKIYTGKKYKVYKVKTNKKGVAKFNTKKLKRGSHKVVISSLNKNYYVMKKSKIKIKK